MDQAQRVLDTIGDLIFSPEPSDKGLLLRFFNIALLTGLFLIGVAHWVYFLNFGEISFVARDWPKELVYYSVLRQVIVEGFIPFDVVTSYSTSRFLANLETVLSPQIILLAFMSAGKFVMVNTIILYSLGFLGCLLIRKRYRARISLPVCLRRSY